MKKLLTLIFTVVVSSAQAYMYAPQPARFDPYNTQNVGQNNTIIRHQNGANTYIQNNNNSATIRYSDGSVDYVQYR